MYFFYTARLFEVGDDNLAYNYADVYVRGGVGDELYDEEKEEKSDDPWIILKQWKLEQYGEVLIDEEGYDDIQFWKDISEQELKNMEWENDDGKKMKWKNGHIKKFIKLASQL